MPTSTIPDGIGQYFEAIQRLQSQVIDRQRDLLSQVAQVMFDTVQHHGRIFVFGTGHSHMLAEEGHYRAGGLAAVVPIFSPGLMLHESAIVSGQLERTPGIAEPLLNRYSPRAGEMLFIFSNSGVNLLPLEMALAGQAHGLKVVAVCSMAYARVAPLSALGKRLFEVADNVLDNGGEPGDSLVCVEGSPWRVGPSSTIIGALLWNCLITEVAFRLQLSSTEVPIYASANLPGAAEHNAALLSEWRALNPHL
jgi:uncharacterized phosphosugar-binding protein